MDALPLKCARAVPLLVLWAAGALAEDSSEQVAAVEEENQAQAERLEALEADQEALARRVDKLSPLLARVSGYLDVGFFAVQGDGSGVRTNAGGLHPTPYDGELRGSWILFGDPLSTAINSRGEAADTGASRAAPFDAVDSGGRPTFMVNAVALALFAGIGDSMAFNAAFEVLPRARLLGGASPLQDLLDVKVASVRWSPEVRNLLVDVWAGKFDPVLGVEYSTQDSPLRLGVTPSLLCRYTCGRATGVKARVRLARESLSLAAAVTSGPQFVRQFPLSAEREGGRLARLSGRVAYRLGRVELGGSGAVGPQQGQARSEVQQWHWGLDLQARTERVRVSAEWVMGRALGWRDRDGPACGAAPCLFYRGAYAELGYQLNAQLTPYARWDLRLADHRHGAEFAYLSRVTRGTIGMRAELGTQLILKAEYVLNRSLEGPEFPHDVFTSSLVLRY